MKVCSNEDVIASSTPGAGLAMIGSSSAASGPPPRSSSQLADQVILVSSPVIRLFGRATGMSSPSGALIRFS